MYQPLYEDVVRFASEGVLAAELQRAKAEYVEATGELFETDATFERRIAAFLEWYALDRKLSTEPLTPVELYTKTATVSDEDRPRLQGLAQTTLSLFEFRRALREQLNVTNLLTGERIQVFERRKPAGLEAGDILEARLVPYDGKVLFADAYYAHPREARKFIVKAAKRFRKSESPDRIGFVHRVAYFSNRCERYKHLSPKQIFAELEAEAAA
jgi:hypothetical protein